MANARCWTEKAEAVRGKAGLGTDKFHCSLVLTNTFKRARAPTSLEQINRTHIKNCPKIEQYYTGPISFRPLAFAPWEMTAMGASSLDFVVQDQDAVTPAGL